MKWILTMALAIGSLACSTTAKRPTLVRATGPECEASFRKAPLSDVLKSLEAVSDLYDQKCYREVISLGDYIRNHSRDKYYHFFNETMEMIAPEGTFTEYVLESYERTYLSFLIALSYQQLALQDDAQVELRKAYEEGQAMLYNFGDDPVNLVLQAALWENSHSTLDSRPLWKKVTELASDDFNLKTFAEQRIQEIDSGQKPLKPWRIYSVGKFPEMDWSPDLKKSSGSYFSIQPKTGFLLTCSSERGLLLPTASWAQKISHKYDRSYHPLLHLQTWTRLPVGLTVGAVTALSGVTVAVAGCGADFYLTQGASQHPLCNASLEAGKSIAGESGTVTGYVLRPDLRYWSAVPEAILITREDKLRQEFCLPRKSYYPKPLNGAQEITLRK